MGYVCEQCRADIDPEASVCPHCGYDPAADIQSQAKWRWGVGALLCFTVVGGIIGVPLVISGFLHARKADSVSPAIDADTVTA